MKQIYKRTLALLLTVVLCFSMVPMAAFATEVDSGVSSDIEENPIESVPQDVPNEIDSEMQAADEPVLYARDPLSKVQSDLGSGTNYLTSYGVTRKAIVDELSAHEHDSYYLGTQYAGGDVQSPNQ